MLSLFMGVCFCFVFLAPFCHFFRCCWKENDKRETMGDRNGLGSSSGGGRGRGGEVIKFYVSKNKYVKMFCLLR